MYVCVCAFENKAILKVGIFHLAWALFPFPKLWELFSCQDPLLPPPPHLFIGLRSVEVCALRSRTSEIEGISVVRRDQTDKRNAGKTNGQMSES